MKLLSGAALSCFLLASTLQAFHGTPHLRPAPASFLDFNPLNPDSKDHADDSSLITGFRDSSAERQLEQKFMAVPDPKLAETHLRTLTQAPHIAGSPEDKATADYVAGKFREAGLETEIVEYKVWFNYPSEIHVDLTAPAGVEMHGPHPEHVADERNPGGPNQGDPHQGDPYQNDPRIVTPYNGMSPSGDVEADVVYANYGSPEDFDKLAQMNVDVRGKIVIMRYGQNFRGVKVFVAQERGAAGVILYSDPKDDGYYRGDAYPNGPWRPASGVQRGSVGFMFMFPGDPTTPGVASTPSLPDSKRVAPADSAALPKIPATPLSYEDATPILEHLGGAPSPREWQGALPFTYHVGPGPAKVKLHLKQNYQYRTIWDVIGKVPGAVSPDEWVVAGNHRDAWVYGAVDPNSGTAALLETVDGLGELLKSGWKPKRTIVFGSWDAEEEGLIGSTEWAEDHQAQLANADAYFNMDAAVSGKKFSASSVPSLKEFIRQIARAVPSPQGGTVYDAWKAANEPKQSAHAQEAGPTNFRMPASGLHTDVPVGDLGSGSDYTAFLQHLGVPSSDIGSTGDYGVYHSAFDDFAWFKKFGDPDFVYEQQMARMYGLEVLRMANADVLPYNYEDYGKEILVYLDVAKGKSLEKFKGKAPNFSAATESAHHLQEVGTKILQKQHKLPAAPALLNSKLREAERALLIPEGLPNRPWYRHSIYAPGEYTGYAAVVIPGVNEAIDRGDLARTEQQLASLTAALNRCVQVLEQGR